MDYSVLFKSGLPQYVRPINIIKDSNGNLTLTNVQVINTTINTNKVHVFSGVTVSSMDELMLQIKAKLNIDANTDVALIATNQERTRLNDLETFFKCTSDGYSVFAARY
jgi:hypothetical protein